MCEQRISGSVCRPTPILVKCDGPDLTQSNQDDHILPESNPKRVTSLKTTVDDIIFLFFVIFIYLFIIFIIFFGVNKA